MALTDFYPLYDGQGNTLSLTDDTQTRVVERYVYTAFGERLDILGDTSLTPFQWNGRWGYYYDEDLGEYHVRARPYGPAIARWLCIDTLLQYVEALTHADAFAYGENNPIVSVDPSGNLTLVPKGHPKLPMKCCGNTFFNQWNFEHALPINERCEGWIIQKVEYYCEIKSCIECPDAAPEKPTVVYYEAFHVPQNSTKSDAVSVIKNKAGTIISRGNDAAVQDMPRGSCGYVRQEASAEFYCLEGDPFAKNGSDTIPKAQAPDKVWTKGKSFGTSPCAITSGTLYGIGENDQGPKHFGGNPQDGPATRSFWAWWCCCTNMSEICEVGADPIFK